MDMEKYGLVIDNSFESNGIFYLRIINEDNMVIHTIRTDIDRAEQILYHVNNVDHYSFVTIQLSKTSLIYDYTLLLDNNRECLVINIKNLRNNIINSYYIPYENID